MDPRFHELSRKAATGTLTDAEQQALEVYLREHPERRADVEWDEAFARQLERKIEQMPVLPGWQRTQAALHASAGAPRRGLLDRLAEWLAASFGISLNMQAAVAVLVVVQAGLIGLLAWQARDVDDAQRLRGGVQDPLPRGPLLRVSFRDDVREADMRRVLAEVNGEIVGGPGQLGVYLVRVRDGDLNAAAQRLRAGGTIVLVEVVRR